MHNNLAFGQTNPEVVQGQKNTYKVRGIIKSAATHEGIAGANVSVANVAATITDDAGKFEINLPQNTYKIIVNAEGFQEKSVFIKDIDKETEILMYEMEYNPFYRIVTVDGKEIPHIQTTESISSVNVEGSNWRVTSNENLATYIQGRFAGLNVVRNSGTPNSGSNFNIRGINSIYGTNKPLIVVDGMIYEDNDYSGQLILNNFDSGIANIDLKDIQSISVVKDGSSIYGTKGGNGVIFIETKSAQELSTRIDFGAYIGYNQAPSNLPLLNSYQHKEYLSELLSTAGYSSANIASRPYFTTDRQTADYYTYNNSTDWQKVVLDNSYNKNYYLRVTGGDNIAKYALSLGYANNESVIKASDISKFNMRLNGDINLSKKFTIKANLSFFYNQQNLRDQGLNHSSSPLYSALVKSPFLFSNIFDADGRVSPNYSDSDIFNISNPAVLISENTIGLNRNYRFTGNIQFKYKLNADFDINTLLGLVYDKGRENFFLPNLGVYAEELPLAVVENQGGSEIRKLYTLYNDTYINYNKRFENKHRLRSRLGIRTQSNESDSDFGLSFNSANDDYVNIGAGSNLLRQIGGRLGNWNWVNFYFANQYSYLDKYLLSLNLALDGSSRFGKKASNGAVSLGDNAFALSSSISGAWLISSENFFNIDNVNLFKLRASYGISGNDDIGNYAAKTYYISQNLLGMQGLVRGNVGNPYLQWERNFKSNVGLDISMLKERLNFTFDYFSNTTKDLITFEKLDEYTGIELLVKNGAGLKNNGFELAVNSRLISKRDIKFDLGLMVTKYKNKVSSLPDGSFTSDFGGATYITQKGSPVNQFFGLKSEGIFSTQAEANSANLSRRLENGDLLPFQAGDVKFVDRNRDNIIDGEDRVVIGDPNADLIGSIRAAFTYKRVSLSSLFTYSLGNDVYNAVRNNLESLSGYENQTQVALNRWKTEGQITNTPRATWGDPLGNAEFSDRWIEDGSYLRLRTVSLGYEIPLKEKLIKSVNIYLSANNVFTVSKYLGYDPEFSLSNSVFNQGIDYGMSPQFRTFQLGFKIGL